MTPAWWFLVYCVVGIPFGVFVARAFQKDLGIPRGNGEDGFEYGLVGFFFVIGSLLYPAVVIAGVLLGLGKVIAKR